MYDLYHTICEHISAWTFVECFRFLFLPNLTTRIALSPQDPYCPVALYKKTQVKADTVWSPKTMKRKSVLRGTKKILYPAAGLQSDVEALLQKFVDTNSIRLVAGFPLQVPIATSTHANQLEG